jgi:hypothetical protein
MVYDSAMNALGRTELRFGWTWEDAARLGIARPVTKEEAARGFRNDSTAAVARLKKENPNATRKDSIAAVEGVRGSDARNWVFGSMAKWKLGAIFLKLLGLLMTAVAISFGAPFWFDTLNKIINVRGEGRAPDEKPRSPEAPGKRMAETAPR